MACTIQRFRLSLFLVIGIAFLLPPMQPAQAQSTTIEITDPAVFAAATTDTSLINFSGILPPGTPYLSFNPLIVSGVSFSTPLAQTAVDIAVANYYAPYDYSSNFAIDSVIAGSLVANPNNELDIVFPKPVQAVALDYGGLGFSGPGSAVITLSNGHTFSTHNLPTVGNTAFVGFLASDPITSLKLITLDDSFVVTDLTIASPGNSEACGLIVGSTSQEFGPSGGFGSIGVINGSGCPPLKSFSNAAWITLFPGLFLCPGGGTCSPSPVALGTVQFSVAANTAGAQRTGNISVGNSTFTVLQDLSSAYCDYAAIPNRAILAASGAAASVAFHANSGCPWTAVSGASWLTVSQSVVSGTGTLTVRAPANQTGATRSTTISAAGRSVTVVQPDAGTTGTGQSACGAVDVSSQFSFRSTGLSPVGFGNWNEYSETITITNNGPPVPLPVQIILVGEPTNNGYPHDSLLYGSGASGTHCFTSTPFGDYFVLPGPQGPSGSSTMPTGQRAGAPLRWYVDTFASMPRYRPIIISGTPNK